MKTLYQIIREFYGENKEDYKQVVYTETVYESKQDAESVLLDGLKVKLAEQGWEFRITEVNLFEAEVTRDQLGERVFEGIYGVLVDNKLNIDPLANELGDVVDKFVEDALNLHEYNKDD